MRSSGFYLSVLDHGSPLAVKLASIAVSAVLVLIVAAPAWRGRAPSPSPRGPADFSETMTIPPPHANRRHDKD